MLLNSYLSCCGDIIPNSSSYLLECSLKKETTAASEYKLDLPVSKDIYINLAGAELGLKSNHCKKNEGYD